MNNDSGLMSIEALTAGLQAQFCKQTDCVVDASISETFSDVCPLTGNLAAKVRLNNGKIVFVHSILIRDGRFVAAYFNRARNERTSYPAADRIAPIQCTNLTR